MQHSLFNHFSFVLGVIIFLMGLAVIVELAYSLFPNFPILSAQVAGPVATKPFFAKFILCFSPYSNLKGIAKTSDTNAGGQIGCLNGMRSDFPQVYEIDHYLSCIFCSMLNRAMSMTWVVLCHSFIYTPGKSTQVNRWVYDVSC